MPTGFASSTRYTLAMIMELTGLTARQIRYYEQIDLLHPERSSGNQRLYAPGDLALLQEIADLKRKGYSMKRVRAVLAARQAAKNRQVVPTAADDEAALQSALLYFKGGRQA